MFCTHATAQWQWTENTAEETAHTLRCLFCQQRLSACRGPLDIAAPAIVQPIIPRPKLWGDWHAGEPDFVPPTYTQEHYDAAWGDWDLPMPLVSPHAEHMRGFMTGGPVPT